MKMNIEYYMRVNGPVIALVSSHHHHMLKIIHIIILV